MHIINQVKLDSFVKLLKTKDFIFSLLVTLIVVATGVFFGYYNNKVVTQSTDPLSHYTLEPSNPLKYLSDWDGPNYINIANSGYTSTNDTNFFPLYPLLIHLVDYVISSSLVSALIISWACLVGAVYFYLKVLKQLFNITDNFEALRGLLFFVLFPTGVFLIATYTESLFALLALGALYFALKRRYLLTGLMAMLATATHDEGVFLLILLAIVLFEEKVKLQKIIVSFIIGCLGLIAYMVYLLVKFNNAFAFIGAQKVHGWLQHGYFSNLANSIGYFNVLFIVLLVVSAIYWWKRRKSFAIYSLLFLLIPLAGGQFGGFNRYVLVAFPLQFMLFATLRNKKLAYPLVMAFMGLFWAYFLFQYAAGYVGG